MKVVISPFAARLPENKSNPKNYPWWPELIKLMKDDGHEIIQLGGKGETRIDGVDQFICGWPLKKIGSIIQDADVWVCVDTWLSHFCYVERLKSGIVLWSQSDPDIWGHSSNINLIKDRKFIRPYQYSCWWDAEHNPDAFVKPQVVMDALHGLTCNQTTKS